MTSASSKFQDKDLQLVVSVFVDQLSDVYYETAILSKCNFYFDCN